MGGYVGWVQGRLRVYGYNIAIDGDYGNQTEQAVRNFQLAHGLAADGVVGPLTYAKLAVAPPEGTVPAQVDTAEPELRQGAVGGFVTHLQGALNVHRIPTTVDGVSGSRQRLTSVASNRLPVFG